VTSGDQHPQDPSGDLRLVGITCSVMLVGAFVGLVAEPLGAPAVVLLVVLAIWVVGVIIFFVLGIRYARRRGHGRARSTGKAGKDAARVGFDLWPF
jgi:hypothetical protein